MKNVPVLILLMSTADLGNLAAGRQNKFYTSQRHSFKYIMSSVVVNTFQTPMKPHYGYYLNSN